MSDSSADKECKIELDNFVKQQRNLQRFLLLRLQNLLKIENRQKLHRNKHNFEKILNDNINQIAIIIFLRSFGHLINLILLSDDLLRSSQR